MLFSYLNERLQILRLHVLIFVKNSMTLMRGRHVTPGAGWEFYGAWFCNNEIGRQHYQELIDEPWPVDVFMVEGES